jgi:flagellar biogenesis protein FliO
MTTPPPSPAPAPALTAPPSVAAAALRVGLALIATAALFVAGAAGYRWLLSVCRPSRGVGTQGPRGWFARWIHPGNETERIDVLARSWIGSKEAVCLIRAGRERFLIGVTPQRVTLLGRMDDAPAARAASAAPPMTAAVAAAAPPSVSVDAAPATPAARAALSPDFALELSAAAREPAPSAPVPPALTEESIRTALSASRQRRQRRSRTEVHVG